jgi:hypothetical protein
VQPFVGFVIASFVLTAVFELKYARMIILVFVMTISQS